MTEQMDIETLQADGAQEAYPVVEVIDKATGEIQPVPDMAGVAALAALTEEEFQRRLAVLQQGRQRVQQIKESLMTQGVDYGLIPGTGDKPTLLKPGAEKLAEFYRLAAEVILHERHGDGIVKPAIAYVAECRLHLGTTEGPVVAVGWGVCTNWERKYRYRRGGQENTDPYEQANTIAKMAEKRAFVDAVLRATASSSLFTQDLEDMYPQQQADQQVRAGAGGQGGTQPPQQSVQPATADTSEGAYCPVHRKAWRSNRRGYYCSGKMEDGGWCNEKPSREWVARQELG